MINLTASRLKNHMELCIDKSLDREVTAAIRVKRSAKGALSSHTYHYDITEANVIKLVKAFGARVTFYGNPINLDAFNAEYA